MKEEDAKAVDIGNEISLGNLRNKMNEKFIKFGTTHLIATVEITTISSRYLSHFCPSLYRFSLFGT